MTDKYKLRPHEELYTACEHLDFTFYKKEVSNMQRLWKEGLSIYKIAELIKRREEEAFLLAVDLMHKGRIKPRQNGVYGIS